MEGKREVKVFFHSFVDYELEDKIDRFFETLGFKRWASGLDVTTGVRDIAYEEKE